MTSLGRRLGAPSVGRGEGHDEPDDGAEALGAGRTSFSLPIGRGSLTATKNEGAPIEAAPRR